MPRHRHVTVSASGNSRVFSFTSTSTDSSIDNLVITNGNLAGDGGSISNSNAAAGTASDVHGAGITNNGVLAITNSDITSNSAGAGGAGGVSSGGGGAFGGFPSSVGGNGKPGGYGGAATNGSVNAGGNGGSNDFNSGGGGLAIGGSGGTLVSGGGVGGAGSVGSGSGGTGGTAGTAGGGGGGGGANFTSGQDGGHGGNASGGIYNSGTLTITDSNITGNLGAGGGGGGSGAGSGAIGGDGGNGTGAIYNAVSGNLTISMSTITGFSGNLGAGGTNGAGATTNGTAGNSTNDINGTYTISGTEQTFTVDNTADVVDGNYTAGNQTLREALNQINPNDTITFSNALNGQTIRLLNGISLSATDSVTIDGDLDNNSTADITISGDANNNSTADVGDVVIFTIANGANVEFDGLVITNGFASGSAGAAGSNGNNGTGGSAGGAGTDGTDATSVGGAINNSGTLTLTNTTISNNLANTATGGVGGNAGNGSTGNVGGGTGYGGGLSGNGAIGGHAGGAVLNQPGGILTLANTTFTGNSAIAGDGGVGGNGGNGGNGTTGGTNNGGGGSSSGGGAGGEGGSAASGVLNLGTIAGTASDGGGNTQTGGIGGAGGTGGTGGSGGSPAGTGSGGAGGTGGTGGAAETSGNAGIAGTDGTGASGGNAGNGGVFDRLASPVSRKGSNASSGQQNNASGAAGGGGGAGGGAGGLNGSTAVVFNAGSGSGTITNNPPTVALQNTLASILENATTTPRVKVADIVVTDDLFGSNGLSLSGADVSLFEIDGTELFLKAGTVLNIAANPSLDVTVEVDDPAVGVTPDDTVSLMIAVLPPNNPPGIALQNTTTTVAENINTTNRVKVADIVITDDGMGTNTLSLSGADASLFEFIANELFIKAGTVLNSGTNPSLDVNVNVDDTSVGTMPDDTAMLSISVTAAVNNPPSVTLQNTTVTLPENTITTNRVKVADIVVSDDGMGTNNLSLSGADASLFEIIANELFIKAGTALDSVTNPSLDVNVDVDDTSVGTTPDDTAMLSITVSAAVNNPPVVTLQNATTTLQDDVDTSTRLKVADIVITDDGLGVNNLALNGIDSGLFEIDGAALYLKAGVTFDVQPNSVLVLNVAVTVDDTTVGTTPDDTASIVIVVSPTNSVAPADSNGLFAINPFMLIVLAFTSLGRLLGYYKKN